MNECIQKYKLSKEQIEIYEWIKNQNINTDENTICYWSKTYDSKRIKEVINFAKKRIAEGQVIRNLGGWVQNFLKTEQAVVDDNCKTNQALVKEILFRTNWTDLKVYEKYVKDAVTGDDLPLTMEPKEFRRALESLFEKSQLYK
jgi:hypothetical protein